MQRRNDTSVLRRLMAALFPAATAALPTAAGAADPVAYYAERSPTVAPPFAWNMEAGILSDGRVSVTYCQGYATEPPGCATFTGTVADGGVGLITLSAARAGLPASPMQQAAEVPVGGGSTDAAVWIGGVRFDVPAFPTPADEARAAYLKAAILSVVPTDLVEKARMAVLAP